MRCRLSHSMRDSLLFALATSFGKCSGAGKGEPGAGAVWEKWSFLIFMGCFLVNQVFLTCFMISVGFPDRQDAVCACVSVCLSVCTLGWGTWAFIYLFTEVGVKPRTSLLHYQTVSWKSGSSFLIFKNKTVWWGDVCRCGCITLARVWSGQGLTMICLSAIPSLSNSNVVVGRRSLPEHDSPHCS